MSGPGSSKIPINGDRKRQALHATDENTEIKVPRHDKVDNIEDNDEDYEMRQPNEVSEADIEKARKLCDKAKQLENARSRAKAFELYKKAIQCNPFMAEPFIARADYHILKENYDLASRNANRVILLQPNNATGYRLRGQARKELQMYDQALVDLTYAAEILAEIKKNRTKVKEENDDEGNSDEDEDVDDDIIETELGDIEEDILWINEKLKEFNIEIKKAPKIDADIDSVPDEDGIEDVEMKDESLIKYFLTSLTEFHKLKPHQLSALYWMYKKETRLKGGILADDMGLGKTISILALIYMTKLIAQKHGQRMNSTLVILPPSLLYQWQEEIAKFFPMLRTYIYYGKNRQKNPTILKDFDIVLTSYYLIEDPLTKIDWFRIVLDEAHLIKNEEATLAEKCCNLIAINRWCLTGTPIHNSLKDFYSLLKFIRHRSLLDPNRWDKLYQGYLKNSQPCVQAMSLLAKGTVLRRMKDMRNNEGNPLIPDLPDFTPREERISLDPSLQYPFPEQQVYALLDPLLNDSIKNKFQDLINKVQNDEVQKPNAPKKEKMFRIINRVQHASIHMALTDQKYQIKDKYQEKYGLISEDELMKLTKLFDKTHPSSKIRKILEILQRLAPDEKCVIVSQWTTVLDLIKKFLEKCTPLIRTISYEGGNSPSEKNKRVNQFNDPQNDSKVLLLSLRAGGIGLNLIGANHLIFVEPHWNPALELQARDRIYRMGQTKPVTIYKLICENTIEERVVQVQKEKINAAQHVLRGASTEIHDFTVGDIAGLLGLSEIRLEDVDQNLGSPLMDGLNPYVAPSHGNTLT